MRPIKMTNKVLKNMQEYLKSTYLGKTMPSSVSLPTKYSAPKVKPTIIVTDVADAKMKALVAECNKEIAWHGVVHRDGNKFTIVDIIVFPQTVTASTVTSNDADYGPWITALPDDIFNNLRFHGHSHVSMGVTPSGTDTQYQSDMMEHITDYYIFAIYNKASNYNIWLYDVTNNLLYDKEDLVYQTQKPAAQDWAKEQIKQFVSEPKITYAYSNKTTGVSKSKSAKESLDELDEEYKAYYGARGGNYGY